MRNSIITLTTGAVGVGKTYSRCAHFLATDFLPEHNGVHYSNFPINKDVLINFCVKKYKLDKDELDRRIQIIPDDVIESWMDGTAKIADYFDGKDLQDAHIAIDEAHNFFPFEKRTDQRVQDCVQFLGEIRHRGCTIELLTQNITNLPPAIREKATTTIEIVTCETDYDPYFKIQNYYWYELRAAYIREYCPKICEITSSQNSSGESVRKYYYRNKYFYPFYDSYSKPFAGGVKGTAPKKEFQKRSFLGIHLWFMAVNCWELCSRFFVVAFVMWLSFGGMSSLVNYMTDGFSFVSKTATASVQPAKKDNKNLKKITSVQKKNLTPEEVVSLAKDTEIEKLKQLVDKKDNLINHVKQELSYNSSISMLTPDNVILSNGYIFKVGDIIDFGIFKGKKISKIRYNRREVVFHDGNIVRLGLFRFDKTE